MAPCQSIVINGGGGGGARIDGNMPVTLYGNMPVLDMYRGHRLQCAGQSDLTFNGNMPVDVPVN